MSTHFLPNIFDMRFFLFFFFSFFVLQASQAQCNRVGAFQDGPDYTLDGSATLSFLIEGTKTLSFDANFSTASGPDLHVYLSQSSVVSTSNGVLQTPNTIEVGLLKSASGSQSYDLTNSNPTIELDGYDYVVIHCKDFDHYWGTATLGTKSGEACASLSVKNKDAFSDLVYPTIVKNNQLFIRLGKNETVQVSFYNVIGEVYQESLVLSGKNSIIDTSFLNRGVYIVKLTFEDKIHAQKIIIQ